MHQLAAFVTFRFNWRRSLSGEKVFLGVPFCPGVMGHDVALDEAETSINGNNGSSAIDPAIGHLDSDRVVLRWEMALSNERMHPDVTERAT